MKEICCHEDCTGCTACVSVCPLSCIHMEPDRYGFLRPVIDQNTYIDCGRCVKVCPNNKSNRKFYPRIAYAAWSLNSDDRETSTSGGIASVLSSFMISQGGVVYGAAYQDGVVKHIRVADSRELYRLKGSKYVQSYIYEDVFTKIGQDILAGKNILFWGTPCQTMGLKSYISNNKCFASVGGVVYGDIICHGVPSQNILRDHLKSVVPNELRGIDNISFRNSDGYFLTVTVNNNILYYKSFPWDKYLNGFQYGLFHRACCYQCRYASSERISDITIGDFWGLGKTTYPKKKVSVILCNTQQGINLIEAVRDKLFLEERPVEEAIRGNSQLQQPSKKHEFYWLFHRLYPRYGYVVAVNISLIKFYVKHFIYEILYKNKCFQKWYNRRRQ